MGICGLYIPQGPQPEKDHSPGGKWRHHSIGGTLVFGLRGHDRARRVQSLGQDEGCWPPGQTGWIDLTPRRHVGFASILVLGLLAGCSLIEPVLSRIPAPRATTATEAPLPVKPTETAVPTVTATPTITPTPTATEVVFPVGGELTIDYLRQLDIKGSQITIEQELSSGANYHRYLASYLSEGNRIYGLLTIPFAQPPDGGFPAIVFNHGYIPPTIYRTTERYVAYVDYLARSGFVVFKIDYRGHGDSEGEPSGSYFSPGYTIDAIAALKSLQTLDEVNPDAIGMWGHSMAGNLVLRAMLIEPDIKAGVIWAGAVYSYDDMSEYGITDNTYRPPPTPEDGPDRPRRSRVIFEAYGRPDSSAAYWRAVSLTENIQYLQAPLQIHHAENDPVVNIRYSQDLVAVLAATGKDYEFYSYPGGGHNIVSPYFDQAMLRTVQFFRDNLTVAR
jgi:alpha-beta hydrolase superfamily lysophospholipase